MATNFVQTGDVLDLTAPAGGVVSGGTYIIGELTVIAENDAAVGETFAARHTGVFTVPILAGDSPTAGANAYFDSGVGTWTVTAGALKLGGYFVGAEIGTTNTANVKLLG